MSRKETRTVEPGKQPACLTVRGDAGRALAGADQWTSQLAMASKMLNALQVNRRLNSTRNRIMLTPFLEDED
jgi:hypothetical protein